MILWTTVGLVWWFLVKTHSSRSKTTNQRTRHEGLFGFRQLLIAFSGISGYSVCSLDNADTTSKHRRVTFRDNTFLHHLMWPDVQRHRNVLTSLYVLTLLMIKLIVYHIGLPC